MASEEHTLRIEDLLAESAWMRRLALALVRDPHVAEDLTQEAMLAALRRPPREGVPIRAWLRGVLRNLAAAWTRGDAHRRQREAALEEPSPEEPERMLEELELQQLLAAALLELPEPYRRTVHLRYFRGLSSAEIARRTGAPEGTVRWRLKRGIDTLRAQLDDEHPGGRAAWVAVLAPLAEQARSGAALASAAATGRLVALGLWGLLALLGLLTVVALRSTGPRADEAQLTVAPAATAAEIAGEARAGTSAERARTRATEPEPVDVLVRLRARLLSEVGGPIAEARLRVEGGHATTTGRDGRGMLALPAELLAARELLTLELTADDHLPRRIELRWRGEAELLLGDLRLVPAGRVTGRALYADGRPAAGAEILLDDLPGRWGLGPTRATREWSYLGSMLPDDAVAARCDEAGRYELSVPATRYVHLWARAPGTFAASSEPVGARRGERVACPDLVLIEPAAEELLAGVVLDPDGEPVAGALVRAWRASRPELMLAHDERTYRTHADERGRFRLPVNPNPGLDLLARDPAGRLGATLLRDLRGGEHGLRVELRREARLPLVVTDEAGVELDQVAVELRDVASGELLAMHALADGLPLPPRAFSCRVERSGFRAARLGPLEPGELDGPLRCALAPAPRVRGRVTSGDGPLAGARVELRRAASRGGWRAFPELTRGQEPLGTWLEPGPPAAVTATDADGAFELTVERAGAHVLLARSPDGRFARHGPFDASAVAEELTLRVAGTGAIGGRVRVDAPLEPEGTLVAATDALGALRVTRADELGDFRFDALAEGRWMVRALERELADGALLEPRERELREPGEPLLDVLVIAGGSAQVELDLREQAGFALEGELLFDGASPGPWRVELLPADAPPEARGPRAELDPEGRFRLETDRGGEHVLRAWLPDYERPRVELRAPVALAPGVTRWNAALATGTVAPRADELDETRWLVWRGEEGLRCEAPVRPDDVAAGRSYRLPAGTLAVERRDRGGAPETLRELGLAAGATLTPLLD